MFIPQERASGQGRVILHRLTALLPLLLAAACAEGLPMQPAPLDRESGAMVLAWNNNAVEAITAHDGYADPLNAVRSLAIMHIAQHDAVNAVRPAFRTYAFQETDAAADARAAAAAAAHQVLVGLYPAQQALLDQRLAESLADIADGQAETRGVELGRRAADAILARRANDGSDTPIVGDYQPGTGPGKYQFTPGFDFLFLPGWDDVTPFALATADQFRVPAAPPALTSDAYAQAFAEVKAYGIKEGSARSADQTSLGKFWYEFSDIGWNRIARVVAEERRLGLQSSARLFALLDMAMSDAYVAGWDSKGYYDFWRPYTAIRAAADDGNAATAPDATWEPLMPTPPVQDYPSTHAALGNAAAVVLASVFGDRTRFTFTSTTAETAGGTRTFTSFSQAADENADSRVMAGLHFRFATDAGQTLGTEIGRYAVKNHLLRR